MPQPFGVIPTVPCRTAWNGSVEIGEVRPDGCTFGYAGRQPAMDTYEVVPQGRENGMSQYVCRAQGSNTVRVGKVSENQAGCHIGMQGSEAVATVYEVLGD